MSEEINGWKTQTLGSVIELIGGGTPKTSILEYWNGDIPWLSVVDFNVKNKYVFDTEKTITKKGLENSSSKMLKSGDIIISARGTVGALAVLGLPMAFNQSCYGIRGIEGQSITDYIYYLLKDTVAGLKQISHGGVFDTITRETFNSITVLLPSLPEQKAIANVLSSLDDKIDLLHRQNKTIESMAETLFRQWFIEEAQEEWADTTLDCHSEVLRGLSYKGSGLSDSGLGIPMHNLNSIYEGGGYKEVGIKYYTGEFKERHLIRNADIIVANTEQGHEFKLIGCPAIVPSFYGEKGLFSQHIYRVILKENSYLTTEYLYYLLLTPYLREQIISATNGSTVNMLAIDGLQRPKFKLPPKEKVAEFSEIVISWWKKKDLNHFQIRTLEKLRDTLLPKLMSGEVRVMS